MQGTACKVLHARYCMAWRRLGAHRSTTGTMSAAGTALVLQRGGIADHVAQPSAEVPGHMLPCMEEVQPCYCKLL
jgi:hypothetical protein